MVNEQPAELSDDALDSLAEVLLALKEKARDLIVLHYYTGHTLKETAEMMGMSQCQGDPQKGAGEPAGVLRGQMKGEKLPC